MALGKARKPSQLTLRSLIGKMRKGNHMISKVLSFLQIFLEYLLGALGTKEKMAGKKIYKAFALREFTF